MYTRRIAKWNDNKYVTVKRGDYQDINTITYSFVNPWGENEVALDGTDGVQFHPLIDESTELSVFTNEIARNGYFTHVSSNTDDYDGLNVLTYQIKENLMWAQDYNPDNKIFNTQINGTTSMATVLRAPVLVSKGHYF